MRAGRARGRGMVARCAGTAVLFPPQLQGQATAPMGRASPSASGPGIPPRSVRLLLVLTLTGEPWAEAERPGEGTHGAAGVAWPAGSGCGRRARSRSGSSTDGSPAVRTSPCTGPSRNLIWTSPSASIRGSEAAATGSANPRGTTSRDTVEKIANSGSSS